MHFYPLFYQITQTQKFPLIFNSSLKNFLNFSLILQTAFSFILKRYAIFLAFFPSTQKRSTINSALSFFSLAVEVSRGWLSVSNEKSLSLIQNKIFCRFTNRAVVSLLYQTMKCVEVIMKSVNYFLSVMKDAKNFIIIITFY